MTAMMYITVVWRWIKMKFLNSKSLHKNLIPKLENFVVRLGVRGSKGSKVRVRSEEYSASRQ